MVGAIFEPEWQHVAELIRARGRHQADRLAVEVAGRAMTYGELDAASDAVGFNLARLSVGPGDRVASMAYNCIEQLLVWFGCAKIGAIWVPLNVSLAGQDLSYSLRDAWPGGGRGVERAARTAAPHPDRRSWRRGLRQFRPRDRRAAGDPDPRLRPGGDHLHRRHHGHAQGRAVAAARLDRRRLSLRRDLRGRTG